MVENYLSFNARLIKSFYCETKMQSYGNIFPKLIVRQCTLVSFEQIQHFLLSAYDTQLKCNN